VPKASLGLVELAERLERVAEIGVCVNKRRLERNRAPVLRRALFEPMQARESQSKVIMSLRVVP